MFPVLLPTLRNFLQNCVEWTIQYFQLQDNIKRANIGFRFEDREIIYSILKLVTKTAVSRVYGKHFVIVTNVTHPGPNIDDSFNIMFEI